VNVIAILIVVVVVLLAFAAAEELKFRAVDEWSRQLVELFSLLLNLAIAAQGEGTMKISQNRFLQIKNVLQVNYFLFFRKVCFYKPLLGPGGGGDSGAEEK
jgi:hypothetical protein